MIATNMNQLELIILNQIKKAMDISANNMLSDMYDETYGFYTQSNPKEYIRTGALGNTPKVSVPMVNKNSVSFEAYLDKTHKYLTGKEPSMSDVLNLANYGITNSSVGKLFPTLGKQGFWERAKNKMLETFEEDMKTFLK